MAVQAHTELWTLSVSNCLISLNSHILSLCKKKKKEVNFHFLNSMPCQIQMIESMAHSKIYECNYDLSYFCKLVSVGNCDDLSPLNKVTVMDYLPLAIFDLN